MKTRAAFVTASILLCASASARAEPAPPPPETATFALVVGANKSVDEGLAPLKYADDDAARYFDLFRLLGARTTVLARLDDNTRRLHPQAAAEAREPNKRDLDAAFKDLATQVKQAAARGVSTTVYVVYAGHGNVKNGQGYITLEDARVTGADLALAFAAVPATRIHLIVDACASFFLAYGRGPGGKRRAVDAFATLPELTKDPRVGLVLSTSSARESHEWDAFQAGVFSHEVRSGLYGAADANGDGIVTYRELAAFVARANAAVPNEKFRPDVHTRPPRDGDALADIRGARARRVEIGGAHAGHYFLEDSRGVRLLDVHNATGQALSVVRPPPGGPVFLRRVGDDRELRLPADRDVVAVAELTPEDPRIASRGAAHESFSALFSLPFDRAAVDSYREPPARAPAPEEERRPPRGFATRQWVGLGVGGVGVLFAGAGAAFGLDANATKRGLAPNASQAEADAANSRIARGNALAITGLAVGGAAIAAGSLLLLWPRGAQPPVTIAPVAGGAVLGAGARF